jgi:hypothetical protein
VKGQKANGLDMTNRGILYVTYVNSDSHLYGYYFEHCPFFELYLSVI